MMSAATPSCNLQPALQAIVDQIRLYPAELEVISTGVMLEVSAVSTHRNGLPNRARIRAYCPRPSQTLVFFFKTSLIGGAQERHCYGGIDLKNDLPAPAEVRSWLDYLVSGFNPDIRPDQFQRTLRYLIPE
jgi:hypothetical protein